MHGRNGNGFKAPVFVSVAFLVLAAALVEKALNLVGGSIPFIDVYPRQLLDWALTLLIFDIALLVRQIAESKA